ncbi:NUDIX domain-containing protein [Candidatus Woesearchaeota archaeon]|nr:NUDIX domain-containing protein [Candidatus Woesearchaeota archaeon]
MKRPKVGVGVFVLKDGKVLFQQRMNAHGEGTWCLPGGHLEFHEDLEECAKRETKEELGIEIKNVRFANITNDKFIKENKHYITIFMLSDFDSGIVEIKEPDKTRQFEWFEWNKLPEPLFLPLQNLIKQGYDPFQKNESLDN